MNESLFYRLLKIVVSFLHQDIIYSPPPLTTRLFLSSSGQYYLHKLDGHSVVGCGIEHKTTIRLKSDATINFSKFRVDVEEVFSKLAINMGSLEMLTVLIVAQMALWIQAQDYDLIIDYKEDGEISIYGHYGRSADRINEIKIPPGVIYVRHQP